MFSSYGYPPLHYRAVLKVRRSINPRGPREERKQVTGYLTGLWRELGSKDAIVEPGKAVLCRVRRHQERPVVLAAPAVWRLVLSCLPTGSPFPSPVTDTRVGGRVGSS